MANDNPGSRSRIKENSKLFIKCANANWELFTEQTETHDISESGISFYLKTPVWVDSHLTIIIASSTLFGRLCSVSAKVVRVQVDTAGRQLVAARFDD
jgi:PilZ domain-containing protein